MNSPPRSPTHPLSSRTLLALTEAMEHAFDASAWARLGEELGMPQLVDPELRLQKSLRFGDDDYGYCVAQFIRHLDAERPGDLHELAHRPEIRAWLESNASGAVQELGLGETVVAPTVASASASASASAGEAVEQALRDAHHTLGANGPAVSIQRLHDALRGYLLDACVRADLRVADDATVVELYWLLSNDHPRFAAQARCNLQVGHVLASLAGAVTALATLRSDAPTAHASPSPPGQAEVVLMADLVRTIFNYLSGRL
jgi:hypothetical protein